MKLPKSQQWLLAAITSFSACQSVEKQPPSLSDTLAAGQWIDLTHDFSDSTIYWPNNPTGFVLDTQFNGITDKGYFYSSNAYCSPEHGGTHIDAPVHFAEGKWSLHEIPVTQGIGEAVVVDVTAKTMDNPDYQANIEDIESWEKEHGRIPDGAILLIRTGWSLFYHDVARYLGTSEKGEAAVQLLHFPAVDPALASWLVSNRKIKALGVDTPSVDYGQSKDFKTHQILYAENIPGFENLTGLENLPATGAYLVALPMKIRNGTGGPLRMVAWVPRQN